MYITHDFSNPLSVYNTKYVSWSTNKQRVIMCNWFNTKRRIHLITPNNVGLGHKYTVFPHILQNAPKIGTQNPWSFESETCFEVKQGFAYSVCMQGHFKDRLYEELVSCVCSSDCLCWQLLNYLPLKSRCQLQRQFQTANLSFSNLCGVIITRSDDIQRVLSVWMLVYLQFDPRVTLPRWHSANWDVSNLCIVKVLLLLTQDSNVFFPSGSKLSFLIKSFFFPLQIICTKMWRSCL